MWARDALEYYVTDPCDVQLSPPPSLHKRGGISINTRTLQPGDVFFALTGHQHDGHDHVRAALDKGASFVVVERLCDSIPASKQIIVNSTQRALTRMAQQCRTHTNACVIAITGSAGKTTVKDWVAHILGKVGPTTFAQHSFNNDIGVPYSLACLTPSSQFGVFEVGMNHPGEIAPLAIMIRPHIAAITSICEAHIGHMGSMEAIAEEKSEIFRGLDEGHIAIMPREAPHFKLLHDKASSFNIEHILTFGVHEDCDARLMTHTENSLGGHDVSAIINGKSVNYTIQLSGEHGVLNSLCVALICARAGASLDAIVEHIATFQPPLGRGRRLVFKEHNAPHADAIIVIDDAYNANPSSMRAGLLTFSNIPHGGTTGHAIHRKIAVLGAMKELGDDTETYHASLGHMINTLSIDQVFTVGDEMKALFAQLHQNKQGQHFDTPGALVDHMAHIARPHDCIFVKGSKSSYVSRVVDHFISVYS